MSVERIRCEVLSWDWCGHPDLDHLGRALTEVSGGTVHLRRVETGSDDYAIVLSSAALSEQEAYAAYREDAEFAIMPCGDDQ